MKTKKMLSTALAITVILSLVTAIPIAAAGTCCCLNCTWTKDAREYKDNYLKCLLAYFVFKKSYDACNASEKFYIHNYWHDVVQRIDTWQSGLWPLIWAAPPPPPSANYWLPPPEGICSVNKTEIDIYLLWGGVVWQNATTYPLHKYEWWESAAQWNLAWAYMYGMGVAIESYCGYRTYPAGAPIPRPYTHVLVDTYKFVTEADLTSNNFNVSIMVQNVTNMGTINLMLGYNSTLISAKKIYPQYPPNPYTANATTYLPVDIPGPWTGAPFINENRTYLYQGLFPYAYVWIGALDFVKGVTYYTSPDPYTPAPVFDIEFHINMAPPYETVPEPKNETLCTYLDLFIMFDTTIFPGKVELLNSTGDPIRHAALDGCYTYIRPQKAVGAPTAICTVTPAKQVVCQNVTFDGSKSKDGVPPDPDDNDDIIWYAWDIGSDGGAPEINTTDPITSWHCDVEGKYNVSLTVCNLIGKTDKVLTPQFWECIKPAGARQDLYTSPNRYCNQTTTFVGKGLSVDDPSNQYVDALAPDVEITLFVECTWNGAPRMHVLVAFEILYEWKLIDQEKGFPDGYQALNESIAYRTAETDKDGIATITFRVPSWCAGLPFGKWLVLASCKIQEIKTVDWIRFDVGYPIWLKKVWTDKPAYHYCDTMTITINAKNIMLMPKHALFIVTVYDDCGVPIGQNWNYMLDIPAGEWCHPYYFNVTTTVHVPQWTYVGIGGMVYVSAFTDWPRLCGTAYCPEVSVGVEFYWVP